jgi:hypothetical protein
MQDGITLIWLLHALKQSVGRNIAMTYKSYQDPSNLYKVIYNSHSGLIGNSRNRIPATLGKLGNEQGENMDDYAEF